MMMRSVEKGLTEMGFKITKIHHCSIAEGKSSAAQYDVVFTPMNFLNMFEGVSKEGTVVIGLRNVMSKAEIKEKMLEQGLDQKYKK